MLGYSLQLLPRSDGTSRYQYNGEWMSSVIPITNDWLCISLNISVPATFHVSVDLVTNTVTKTVYSADNVDGETAATDMLTIFELQIDTTQTSHSQLAIYVSEGTVIRNVDVQNQHCSSTSKLRVLITAIDQLMTSKVLLGGHKADRQQRQPTVQFRSTVRSPR